MNVSEHKETDIEKQFETEKVQEHEVQFVDANAEIQ